MVEEAFVGFKTAELLKEKNFDGLCYDFYEVEYETPIHKHSQRYMPVDWNGEDDDNCYSCPTLQMVCSWFRLVHHIHIEAFCPVVDADSDWFGVTYNVVISHLDNNCIAVNTDIEDKEYPSYEKAIEAGIVWTLENLEWI